MGRLSQFATLPGPQLTAIKERLKRDTQTHGQIADELGVSRHTVDRVARETGLTRRQVSDPPRRFVWERTQDLSWQDQAQCKGRREFLDEKVSVAEQKKVCFEPRECPVRERCLEYALAAPIPWTPKDGKRVKKPEAEFGTVYGGLSPRELHRLKRVKQEVAS